MSDKIPSYIANMPKRIFGLGEVGRLNRDIWGSSDHIHQFFFSSQRSDDTNSFHIDPKYVYWSSDAIKVNKKTGKGSFRAGRDTEKLKKIGNTSLQTLAYGVHRILLLCAAPELKRDFILAQKLMSVALSSTKGEPVVTKSNLTTWQILRDFERKWQVQLLSDFNSEEDTFSLIFIDNYYPQTIGVLEKVLAAQILDEITEDESNLGRYVIVDTRMPVDRVATLLQLFFSGKHGVTPYKFKVFKDRILQDILMVKSPPRTPRAKMLFLMNTNRALFDAYSTTVEGKKRRYRKDAEYEFLPLEPDEGPTKELLGAHWFFDNDPESKASNWQKELNRIQAAKNTHKKNVKNKPGSAASKGKDTILTKAWNYELNRLEDRLNHILDLISPVPEHGKLLHAASSVLSD